MQGYSLGTQVGVLLPYSRLQEAEADKIGLILMAKAGYDPEGGIHFWERFATGKKDQAQVPQFLSTHPPDDLRIQNMKKYLDEARQYYRKAGGGDPPQKGGQWSQHQNRSQGKGY
jgi:predicted Zn-dependent protease